MDIHNMIFECVVQFRPCCQVWSLGPLDLKGTATLMIIVFHMKELYEPWILIPVSSKSV